MANDRNADNEDDNDTPSSLSSIRAGTFLRGLALAKLSLAAGSRYANHKLGSLFSGEDTDGLRFRELLISQAKALATELGQLKGSVMKVGQMLSVYGEHFLPPEVNSILKSLQFESPPLEWKAIEKALHKELGSEKLALLEIEKNPIASASLGQVHRARVKATGQVLVLKVQYPGVDRAIESDLRALRAIFSMAQIMPLIPHLDEIFDEVREMLYQEVDYKKELEHTAFFRAAFASDPRLVVPEVFPEFSSSRVLATSFEDGVTIDSKEVKALSQERRNLIAHTALDVYFRELFVLGRVQTDPHLGNYRVRLAGGSSSTTAQDKLILFDFGALRDFSSEFLNDYREMVIASLAHDKEQLLMCADRLGFSRPDDPEELKNIFSEFCFTMTEPFTFPNIQSSASKWFDQSGSYDWRGSDLPRRLSKKIGEVIVNFKLRAPPREVLFLDRKTGGVFVFLSVLGARLNARPALDEYLAASKTVSNKLHSDA